MPSRASQTIPDTITLDSATIQALYDELNRMHAQFPIPEVRRALRLLAHALGNTNRFLPSHSSTLQTAPKLLEREISMLRLIATGQSNHEIAATLGFTEGTIKQYLSIILRKLDARDRTHAVILATALGLI